MRSLKWYFLLLPAYFFIFTFYIAPILGVFTLSFAKWAIISEPKFIGAKNYIRLVKDEVFLISLRNTLLFTAILLPSLLMTSLLIALLLYKLTKGIEAFASAYYLPMVVAIVITATIWRVLYSPFGYLNQFLRMFNLPRVIFLSEELVIPSISLTLIWRDTGYFSLFIYSALLSIPKSILDAAELDCLNSYQKYRYVILPMMKPVLFFLSLYITIGCFMIFAIVYVMTGGGPGYASMTLLNYMYETGWRYFQMGYAAAQSAVFLCLIILMYYIQRRLVGGGGVYGYYE